MPYTSQFNRFYKDVVAKNVVSVTAKPDFYRSNFLQTFFKRRIAETFFIMILIISGQQFLLVEGLCGPISPITGISLSALFLRGRTMLIGIFLGNLFSYFINNTDLNHALVYSLVFTIYIFLIREICLRWCGAISPLAYVKVFLKFVLVVLALSALHVFIMSHLLTLPLHLSSCWLGDVNGVLYLTPLCLLFEPFAPERYFVRQNWRWSAIAFGILLYQGMVFFAPDQAIFAFSLGLLIMLCLYGFFFPPLPLGVTLLGLSVWYLGISFTLYIYHTPLIMMVIALQAILSISISIYQQRKMWETPILPS